jgi:Leucine-rich repeat (LRR) protein
MLDLIGYNYIQSLPTTIGELKHLTKLWLQGCENLKELPQSIASLFSLSILHLFFVNPLNHYQ